MTFQQQPSETAQPDSFAASMSPDQAFCCKAGPIPLSFSHLLALIPPTTTYVPLASLHTANALFTSFLTAQTLSLIYSSSTPLTTYPSFSEEFSMQSFKAIIQTTKIPVPLPPTPAYKGFTKSRVTASTPRPTPSSATPKSTSTATKPEVPEYYVPFGAYGRDKFIEGRKEQLAGQKWKRISQWDAEECLRPPGSQIEIGDGEVWIELDGVERLWCAKHAVWWELKAWVRTT